MCILLHSSTHLVARNMIATKQKILKNDDLVLRKTRFLDSESMSALIDCRFETSGKRAPTPTKVSTHQFPKRVPKNFLESFTTLLDQKLP